MKLIQYIIFLFIPFSVIGQEINSDSIPRIAPISYEIEGGKVIYGAEMPPLNAIPGAPKPFYDYYWEFGDGYYSFEEKPVHTYQRQGAYKANLWATNNYDNGKPPESRPKSITIDKASPEASINSSSPFVGEEDLMLKRNREPLPDQELVFITSYKNNNDYASNGKLYLFYNDIQFKDDNFTIQDTRMYNGELIVPSTDQTLAVLHYQYDSRTLLASTSGLILDKSISNTADSTKRKNLPLTLEKSKSMYRDYQVVQFHNMQPGEERNIFRTLRTTPKMLKDTAATVTLRSIYVPDENYDDHTVKDTEMEIVTSHDPNKMSTSNGRAINYRFAKQKRIDFKVRFQNNGEGPANTIKLEVTTSEVFDKSTLQVDDLYPECPICPKDIEVNYSCMDTLLFEDKIIFQFNKIYLPGSQQKNVTQKDSTKGFVRYSMKFGENPPKKSTKGKTAIYFDKNEPIYTNTVTTKFSPGVSIGAKAGYRSVSSLDNYRDFFVGATISPYKPHKGYLQAEIMLSKVSHNSFQNSENRTLTADGRTSLLQISESNQFDNIIAHIVPVSYRYNISKLLAVGAGLHLKFDLSSKKEFESTTEAFLVFEQNGDIVEILPDPGLDSFEALQTKDNIINFQTGAFIGVNLGNARIGPSLGLRYEYYFNTPNSATQLYAIWKF